MNFTKPAALSLAISVGVALVAGHDEKHIEQQQYQGNPTLTAQAVISTNVAAHVTTSGEWGDDRHSVTLTEQPHDHQEIRGDSSASTVVEISTSGMQRRGSFNADAVLKKVGQPGSFTLGATLVKADGA
jgi:hypothetical protein